MCSGLWREIQGFFASFIPLFNLWRAFRTSCGFSLAYCFCKVSRDGEQIIVMADLVVIFVKKKI